MIRVLLAVALAAALFGAAVPAVESAATDRTRASLDRDLDRLARAGHSLLAEDDPGARRTVRITLPGASLTAAGVERFAVGCRSNCAVRYTLDGGGSRTYRLALPLTTADGPIRFGTPGEYRLTLTLVDGVDGRVVRVAADSLPRTQVRDRDQRPHVTVHAGT
ncbi:hypothetical protein JCM30237_20530 [Halolamina litorea]|uniref:DUF7311 domain-containing protein n=1 Tax=Halolamina litorea TaxID=1515593 RepID=A0ABD6BP96_9EURY|nr:hypothetical protein [Halolamina litorea]